MHPASEANATGYFKFKRDEKLQLHLSIQKGSRVGAILFVVTKNNNEKQKFLVDTKHEAFYKTKVKEDDTLTITANSYGTTAGDAEDPVRGLAHNPGLFTYEMAQISMIAWLSPKYKERYPQTAKTLLEHNNTLFSNDMIYDTVIGLAHIKTDHYNPIYDLSSPKYQLDPNKAYTLHRRRLYTSPDNYIYWREHNAKLLKGKSFYSKLVANNTDSVGKLNEAWRLGFRAFKLNLYYMADKKSFQTGTDKYDTGGNLIDTLSYFKKDKIEHLMLHLANLSKDNLDAILERLNTIKSKLPSQEKITLLVENSNFIEPLKAKGWRVALKSSQLAQSSADSLVIDIKNLKKEQIQNSSTSLIINHAFNLANSKLEKKLSSLEYLNSGIIGAILVDFKSEYQW